MKTSVIKLIVTIAAVGMCANAALAKKGNSGGNGGGNGGNRSAFKLNASNGNSNISRSLSSSSSNSNKLFKFNGNGNGSGNNNSLSKVLKLNGNNNTSSHQVFKLNGNNGNKNNSIFSNNSNKKINISQLLSGNKNDNGNKFFTKKDFCHDGKCFPKHCHDGCCYPHWYNYCHSYPSYPCYGHISTIPVVCVGYEPLHCNYVVLPGDTLYSIAFMEYGTSVTAKDIAVFNGLGLGFGLTPGLILNLPSINPSGALTPSGAPIADALRLSPINANAVRPASPMMVGGPIGPMTSTAGPMVGPTGPMAGPVGPTTATAGTSPVAPSNMEAPRPTMIAGSSLQVDGQVFGDKPGMARLLIGGKALKIDVLEWFSSAIKIRLPQVELAGPSSAEIEILRADGSVAAKTPVELVPATGVALTK